MSGEPNPEVVARLPLDVQAILKRKSSRDPNSRFSAKLFSLLLYVANMPTMEDDIGVAWISDDTFKMNKHALASVLGIKLNTLNVNLRDLEFQQQGHKSKDGWTCWKKNGFTRTSTAFSDEIQAPVRPPAVPAALTQMKASLSFNLGCMQPASVVNFSSGAQVLWKQLTGGGTSPMGSFLHRAAAKFKQEGQQEHNALEVLTAIISPRNSDHITFDDFAKFMAMFGPEKTVMLKIASLLDCSHRTGQWLYFDTESFPLPPVYGAFDPAQPNCLVLHNHETITRIWNLPLIEVSMGNRYIIDERGKQFTDWREYFDAHPVTSGPSFFDLAYLN
jgi:hypothetical protein